MIDQKTLDYSFDEEVLGFGEPEAAAPPAAVSGLERLGQLIVAVGVVSLLV